MLTFNIFDIIKDISHFFWPFIRILAFFSTLPIFNDKIINSKNKIILSFFISWIITPFLPKIHVLLFSSDGLILLFHQILIGILIGFIFQLFFAGVNLSGEILGLQIGLSFATFFELYIHIGASIISRLLNILTLFIFLSLNMHLYLISILVDSFYMLPIDSNFLHPNFFLLLLNFAGCIFINGIMLVFPIIVLLLSVNIIMSILNRLSPQLSIFSIGFSLNLLIGIFSFYFLIPMFFPFLKNVLHDFMFFVLHYFLNQ